MSTKYSDFTGEAFEKENTARQSGQRRAAESKAWQRRRARARTSAVGRAVVNCFFALTLVVSLMPLPAYGEIIGSNSTAGNTAALEAVEPVGLEGGGQFGTPEASYSENVVADDEGAQIKVTAAGVSPVASAMSFRDTGAFA